MKKSNLKRTLRLLTWLTLSVILLMMSAMSCSEVTKISDIDKNAEATEIAPLFKSAKYQDDSGIELPYRYFQPTIQSDNSQKYPVILYLHGEDECGTDNETQLVRTECATIWVEPDHLEKNPAYVLAPQVPQGTDWTIEPIYNNVLQLLSEFIENHPDIDSDRIYIVGFSMGGTGVWNMILKNPKLFAAAMPISGNADNFLGNYEAFDALKNLPVLVVHSIDDPISPVSGSNNAIAALRAAGNQCVGANTSIWGLGSVVPAHDAWYPAFHNYEVIYNWLFEQSLTRTEQGKISPTTFFTTRDLGNGVKQIWDYSLGTVYVVERQDKAIIIDAGAGETSIFQFIKDEVLENKDVDLDILITHNHFDHIVGLTSFLGSSQLKNVYVHQDDSESVKRLLGSDADKVILVKDGDKIPFNGEEIEVISIPGHTWGCVAYWYKDNLFSGDAIGSSDAWLGSSALSVEDYIESVQHLADKIGDNKLRVYGGHSGENRSPLTEEYVHQMLACAKGLVDGTITSKPYRRTIGGQMTLGSDATYGGATIVHNLNNIHRVKGALRSLRLSSGAISPNFAPYTAYYSASVDSNTKSITITPEILSEKYNSITVNGVQVESGLAYDASLVEGKNRFSIVVEDSDNSTKTYTLNITRANPTDFTR